MTWRYGSLLCVLVFNSACGKSTRSAPDRSLPTASASASPAGSVRATSPDERSQETALVALTQRWNKALASRQANDLTAVYAANVNLYGKTYTRDAAVALKRAALVKSPDYTQSLGPVAIDWKGKDQPRALFEKKWSQDGKTFTVTASLTFVRAENQWLISEESDVKADQYKVGSKGKSDTCEDVVSDLVSSTKAAKELVKGLTQWGTRVYSEKNPYSVAIYENMPDHLVTLGWFDVDVRTGVVKSDGVDEKGLVGTPALVAKVKAVCKVP